MRALLLLVILVVAGSASVAHAEPPACFPERTVFSTSLLRDANGTVVGGVRIGQVVRVVADFVGERGEWADIELGAPVAVRVRIEHTALVLYARHDLEVDPGFSWWASGYPVTILRRGADDKVTVTGTRGSLLATTVGCDELSPVPTSALTPPEFECELVPDQVARPAGAKQVAINPDTVIKDADRHRFLVEREQAFVLRRKGGRVLIEYVDDDQGIRVRGWVPGRALLKKPAPVTGGVIASACAGDALQPDGERRLLSAPARLLAGSSRGALIASLPAGTPVRVQQASGEYVRVFVQAQAGDQIVRALDGWIHEGALAPAKH